MTAPDDRDGRSALLEAALAARADDIEYLTGRVAHLHDLLRRAIVSMQACSARTGAHRPVIAELRESLGFEQPPRRLWQRLFGRFRR